MANEKKTNPTLIICIAAFVVGLAVAAWGWDKNESTIEARTHGAVFMIVAGCIVGAAGLLGMALIGGKTKR